MTKWSGFPVQDTGVGLHRIIQPLRFAKREGLIDEARMLPFTGDFQTQKLTFNDRTLMEITRGADIMLSTLIYKDDDFVRMLNLRKWSGAKWVIDMDDNMFAVAMDNPAYVGVKQVLPAIQRSLTLCDGITVSVPTLKNLYQTFNPNVFVNPNGIDFTKPYKNKDLETGDPAGKSFDELLKDKRPHQGIRIGWRGASGHSYDFRLIEPVMRQITKDYPQVTFVFFTQVDPHFDFRYEWHGFVPLQDYPETLASLNLDIAVVPLVDSAYNRCKSNLAYLEFSALGIPVVLTPTENQKGMVALEAKTNFDWYEHLSNLIEKKDMRLALGQKANEYVKLHYDMRKLIYPLHKWLTQLPRRTDMEPETIGLKK